MRVQLVELSHFGVGSPSLVAVPSFSEVEIRECFEAPRRMEPRGQLIRQSFVLEEALLARGPNGLLIQTFGLQFPAFQASNLRANQRRSVCEILWTVLRPEREALVMFGQCPGTPPSLIRSCRIRRGRCRERCIEVVVGLFKQTARCPEQRSRLRSRRDCLRVVACVKPCLQITNPIPADDVGRTCLEMLLETTLVERVVGKRAELPRQTPQRPDETELRRHNVNDRAEARFLPEFERGLGFALHL